MSLACWVRLMKAPRSKYGAKPTIVDNISFHSAKEARRYRELTLWQKSGGIRCLRLQPRYTLCALSVRHADCRNVNAGTVDNRRQPVAHYVADFEYEECDHANGHRGWRVIVEDVKGVRTALYQLKKKLFETQYGIQIRET